MYRFLALFLLYLPLTIAQSPKCDPCVDGPEMFEHRNGLKPEPAEAIAATDIADFPDTKLEDALAKVKNLPYCKLESATSHELDAPPRNAAALRGIARHHPRKNTFGPPA